MPGESPLQMMMQPTGARARRPVAPAPRRALWQILAAVLVLIILGFGWSWLWYWAAATASRTLADVIDREAAAGRVFSCSSQDVAGFPLRIEVRCLDPTADIQGGQPPYSLKAKGLIVTSAVYHPTVLVGDITGPLTLSPAGQPPEFVAGWSKARITVQGVPPNPSGVSMVLEQAHLDRPGSSDGGTGATTLFKSSEADVQARIIDGSASDHPVIEATLRLTGASAPALHPLTAEPTGAEFDVVVRGLKSIAPKPWTERFREIQAAGGGIEIKSMRIAQSDALVVGNGTVTINAHGKLDGLVRIAIVGIEHIVPLLGIDQLIGRGFNRLTGTEGTPASGLGALDRLLPGLGGAVRQTANASIIENLKKMGQPTEIDKKPAIVLPLRISDGAVYFGMLRVGEIPPLL